MTAPEKLKKVTIVVVGFKVQEENSIGYRKFDTPSDTQLGWFLNRLFHEKDADFISVRRIPKE